MKIEISNGELVDKVTILLIKLEKMSDPIKTANIQKEYQLLAEAMSLIHFTPDSPDFKDLLSVNRSLWDIEDQIRRKEQQRAFDDEFIQLARSVYFENDRRAEIKKRINTHTGSNLIEEKQYVDYRS
ncbi:MAG: hypothetical protein EHM72_00090 [Calditrichaeota bacterium]|nr:MAG: hypothetical protein EHM72_00090 [Calditrichota bacterium]